MSGHGEQASPHLVIDVVIQAAGAWLLEAARARSLTFLEPFGQDFGQLGPGGWLGGN